MPWRFMNYGFHSSAYDDQPLPLRACDRSETYQIQLYHRMVGGCSLAGKTVLEVGCGRGGGVAFMDAYLDPKLVVGIDPCLEGLVMARSGKTRDEPRLACGVAESLPFGADSFDLLVSIEASHAFVSMDVFLEEAARVLTKGGLLAWADLRINHAGTRLKSGVSTLRGQFERSGLICVHEADLTSAVLLAMSRDESRKRELVRDYAPRGLKWLFRELAALPGSLIHRGLSSGDLVYRGCLLEKKA